MKKFYVIGNPISHSLSPKIFDYFFNTLKINAQYSSKCIKDRQEFISFIKATKNDTSGYNITSPYKGIAYEVVDDIDKSAIKNGSVNCIKVLHNKLIGYNTDEYGFSTMLDLNMIKLDKKNILILGYGKAAEIIVDYISKSTKSNLLIHGRNEKKIKLFINRFSNKNIQIFDNHFAEVDIIINCLSTKIKNKDFNLLLNSLSSYVVDVFIDLNYININLDQILVKKYISGIDMLIYQAYKSFNIWFNNRYQNELNFLEIKKAIK